MAEVMGVDAPLPNQTLIPSFSIPHTSPTCVQVLGCVQGKDTNDALQFLQLSVFGGPEVGVVAQAGAEGARVEVLRDGPTPVPNLVELRR